MPHFFKQLPQKFRVGWEHARSHFGATGLILIGLLLVLEIGLILTVDRGETLAEREILSSLEAEEKLNISDRIYLGNRVASILIMLGGAVVLALSGFWARRLPAERLREFPRSELPRFFWIFLLLAVVVAGLLRAPRLDHSLFNDEELAARKFVIGGHVEDRKTGEWKFREIPWERTLFYSLSGNNHIVQSVASRAAHDTWKGITDARPGEFSEPMLRLGSFLAGLATIAILGIWLAREGNPRAGLVSAFVLALHPWHCRYSAEARGYAFLILFVVAMFAFLGPALRTARWRDWLGFGAAQALALLSFAGAIFLILPVNLAAFGFMVWKRDSYGLRRWLFVSLVGASVVKFFFLPTLLSSMDWLASLGEDEHGNDWHHLREFWAHLLLGIPWRAGNAPLEFGIGIRDLVDSAHLLSVIIFFLFPALFAVGTVFACVRSIRVRWLMGTTLLAIILIAIFREFSEAPFHVWYALYTLLWFVIGIGFASQLTPKAWLFLPWGTADERKKRVLAVAPAVFLIGLYAAISFVPNQRLREHERHPMRAAVEALHGEAPVLDPPKNLRTVAIGSGSGQLHSYDPHVEEIDHLSELEAARSAAEKDGHRLAVYVTGPEQVAGFAPEIIAHLRDSEHFVAREYVKGIEAFWSIQIYEAVPQGSKS